MIQMMPGHDPMLADLLTYRIHEIPPLSALMRDGHTIDEILNMLCDDMYLKINHEGFPQFKCDCSRERVEQVFISIGAKELKALYDDGKSKNWSVSSAIKNTCSSMMIIGAILAEISKN